MLGTVLLFIVGLVVLTIGADAVVRGGSALAVRLGMRPIVVGMTVVSLGTSLPELAIGLSAVADGSGDLAVGNIVGTNLVNTLLVLGLAALLKPIVFESRTLRFDMPVAAVASLLLFILARDGSLSSADGTWLTVFGCAYLVAVVVSSRRMPAEDVGTPEEAEGPMRTRWVVVTLAGGLGAIVWGADLLVTGATGIALDLGLSDAVVGLTVVAIGTSAPELVTTVVSTFRGDRAIALGNLMGSNVFNIALVLGPTVLASSTAVPVPDDVLGGDLLLMVAAALVCIPAFLSHKRLTRLEGGLFVVAYVVYLAVVIGVRT